MGDHSPSRPFILINTLPTDQEDFMDSPKYVLSRTQLMRVLLLANTAFGETGYIKVVSVPTTADPRRVELISDGNTSWCIVEDYLYTLDPLMQEALTKGANITISDRPEAGKNIRVGAYPIHLHILGENPTGQITKHIVGVLGVIGANPDAMKEMYQHGIHLMMAENVSPDLRGVLATAEQLQKQLWEVVTG
jgi:hypothetical protein